MRHLLLSVVLVGALGLVGPIHTGASTTTAGGLILYRSAPSTTATPTVVHLWTTDSKGKNAQELISLKPVGNSDALRAAYLVPDGLIFAERNANDGNLSDIAFAKRGSHHANVLFSVRGLFWLRPSPDGKEIVYSRSLPVAGKPLLVIARRDGTIMRTLAHATSKTLSWSSDGRRVFAYGVTPGCWFCMFSVSSGAQTAITNINLDNLWGGWPSVSPSGERVAFPDAKGPAGERIYSTKGSFLRNLVGHATASAFWSPNEAQLLLQPQNGAPLVYSFKTKRLTPFVHGGPAGGLILDWR
jgi:hypothetical protein